MKKEIVTKEKERTYILDHTNHLIHFYRCSKVGEKFERFDAEKYWDYYSAGYKNTCETCKKIVKRKTGGLINAMIKMVIGVGLISVLYDACGYRYHELWIESPNGFKTQMPLYEALRIVRKHDWKLAEVEPVKPELSRWQHFKKAIGVR
jgi:hypothetical protein